jgi:hypothetical protein
MTDNPTSTPTGETPLEAKLRDYAYKSTMLASFERDTGRRNAFLKFGQAFGEAAVALAAERTAREQAENERNELREQRRTSPQEFRVQLAKELGQLKSEAWQWAQRIDERRFLSIGEIASVASCLRALYWYGQEVYGDPSERRK